MGRTWLVARREVLENVRTKTFWIGILSFPVILTLSILVPSWLERKTDVRRFGVEDRSGWVLDEVQRTWSLPDFERLAAALKKEPGAPDLPPGRLPACLGEDAALGRFLREADPKVVSLFAELAPLASSAAGSLEGLPLPAEIRERAAAVLAELEELRSWWGSLPDDAKEELRTTSEGQRYVLAKVAPEAELIDLLEKDRIFAYFVINEDPVAGEEGARYVSKNLTDMKLRGWFQRHVARVVRMRRIQKLGLDPRKAEWLARPFTFKPATPTAEGTLEEVKRSDVVLKWAPVAFVYLLWISVFMMAQMLLTNTIEEKSNRIIEVLLSSVTPTELMSGKILGIALSGLLVMLSWIVFFILGIEVLPLIFPKAGPVVQEFGLGRILQEPAYLLSFVAYFLAGYLLFSSLLAGIGSVCNSLKEAQNLQQPVIILLLVPLFAMVPVASDPNGTLARVLSFIPPFTPFVMMNRAGGPPEPWEYAATGLLLLVSIRLTFAAAAKVFRIGVLMTGKPPRVREILRWLRTPEGTVPKRRD